ncbi:MAG: hypothetical protein WCB11_14945 [Terriglobales bacterium]
MFLLNLDRHGDIERPPIAIAAHPNAASLVCLLETRIVACLAIHLVPT